MPSALIIQWVRLRLDLPFSRRLRASPTELMATYLPVPLWPCSKTPQYKVLQELYNKYRELKSLLDETEATAIDDWL